MITTTTGQVVNSVLHFPYSSIQFLADANQCQHLSDESIKYLTLETTGIVRLLLADALKFTQKCRRTKMLSEDFESAMNLRDLDPIFGSPLTNENVIFKTTTSSNHREVQYLDDHEQQLDQVVAAPLPKLPLDISIRVHWLSIDGKQPIITENPDIISKSDMTIDPMKALTKKRYNLDSSKIKSSNPHELSLEQQIFYKEITEACVSSEKQTRQEALASLMNETGLHQILPRLVLFISEGVKVNLMQNNLAILIYLMQMINSLLENKSVYCERYLHQLFPTVISCILSRQLCSRPDVDNHWALRDFAASRCAHMVKTFSTNVHGLRNRIVRIFLQTFHDERRSLVTHYGALIGLCEMGQETIVELVFPLIRILGDRIVQLENSSLSPLDKLTIDKLTIDKINNMVMKYIPTAYRASHALPDDLEYFKHEFGPYYDQRLYNSVIQIYQRTPSHPTQVSIQIHLNDDSFMI